MDFPTYCSCFEYQPALEILTVVFLAYSSTKTGRSQTKTQLEISEVCLTIPKFSFQPNESSFPSMHLQPLSSLMSK